MVAKTGKWSEGKKLTVSLSTSTTQFRALPNAMKKSSSACLIGVKSVSVCSVPGILKVTFLFMGFWKNELHTMPSLFFKRGITDN